MASVVVLVLAPCCPAALAQTGVGLEPGVHIDPGSPAAKQYTLPLRQARQTGAGSSSSGSSSAAPFGAGIQPPGSGGTGSSGSSTRHARGGGRGLASTPGRAGASGQQSLPAAVLRASRSPASSGGSGSILALLGGAVAVLVLGGLGGMIMRQRHSPASSA